MAGVAGNQNELVNQSDGGDFQISNGKRSSRLLQFSADSAADKGGLAIETKNIHRWQQNFLQVPQMMGRSGAFTGAINDLRDGDGGNVLLIAREVGQSGQQTRGRLFFEDIGDDVRIKEIHRDLPLPGAGVRRDQ